MGILKWSNRVTGHVMSSALTTYKAGESLTLYMRTLRLWKVKCLFRGCIISGQESQLIAVVHSFEECL